MHSHSCFVRHWHLIMAPSIPPRQSRCPLPPDMSNNLSRKVNTFWSEKAPNRLIWWRITHLTFNQVSDPLYPICRPFSQSKICASTFTNLHKSSSKLNSMLFLPPSIALNTDGTDASLGPSPERPLSNPALATVTMPERAVELSELICQIGVLGVDLQQPTAGTPKF